MADRNGYNDSILQTDYTHCYLCGANDEKLDRHEIFGGARRSKSKMLGLWVSLCHNRCHENGILAVHRDSETRMFLQERAQQVAMRKYGWSQKDFIREFGKSYLED